ncbi:MAG TPA: AI-2E family transporter [Candidatus Faecousia faecavium]|nr:AI-2E family transporter [Candidatus Faecousia faecavium]
MHFDKRAMRSLFLLIAGCIVFGWLVLDTARAKTVFDTVWNLISPFVAGAGIAFIFNVPMRIIEHQLDGIHRLGIRRAFAIIMTILALILVIMFVIELLVPQIQLTWTSLSEKIPAFIDRTANNLMVIMEDYPDLRIWIQEKFNQQTLNWTNVLGDALAFLGNQISTVMGSAVIVIGSVTGALINTVVAIAFAVYCLIRKEILARQGRRILYALLPEHAVDEIIRILRLTNSTFSNFISGQCLEACILGCLFAIAMAIFKMPYIPLVSVIIGVTALIPVVGAFVGCVVGAFFILVNDPFQALTFVAMFLVIQQLENNLIYPRVVGTSIGLPGMWVLVAVTVGGGLMGVGGMLLMIPLASVCYTLAREFTDKRLAERNIPEEKLMNQPPDIRSQFQKNRERKQQRRLQKMKEQLLKMQQNQKKK